MKKNKLFFSVFLVIVMAFLLNVMVCADDTKITDISNITLGEIKYELEQHLSENYPTLVLERLNFMSMLKNSCSINQIWF